MRFSTTMILLLLVVLLGGYLFVTEPSGETDERRVLITRQGARLIPERIRGIRIDTPSGVYILAQTNRAWRLTYPVNANADPNAVAQILETLNDLRWSQRINAAEQQSGGITPETHGFTPPRASFTLEDGDQNITVIIGRDSPGAQDLYIRRDDMDDIFVTGRQLLDIIPASALTLRDRRLINLPPDRVRRIEWTTREGPFHVARTDGDAWQIEQPVVARAHGPAIRQWLNRMYEFVIHEFVAETVAAAALYGFDQPVRQVALMGDHTSGGFVLRIGNPADKGSAFYYANVLGQDQVFTVPAEVVNWIEPARRSMRDYRLMVAAPMDISSIYMADGDTSIQLARDTQGVWEVTAPLRTPADNARVEQLIQAWTCATVREFIDPPIRDLTPYGLQTTSRIVRLSRTATTNAPVTATDRDMTLILGTPTGSGAFFAMPASGAPVMELHPDLLNHFTVSPLAFRDPVVLTIDRASVQRIIQQTSGVTNAVETTNGLFRATLAGHATDTDAIDNVLHQVSRLEALQFIEENPADLARYGLGTPYAQVTVGLSTGGLSRILLIGSAAWPEGQRYAMRQGTDVVFTLSTQSVHSLLAPVSNPIAPLSPAPPSTPAPE